MVYDLPLADGKIKPHQVTALHLISALAFIGTGAIIFIYNYTITYWGLALLIAGVLLLVATMFRNRWVSRRNVNTALRIGEMVIALGLVVLSAMNGWKFPVIIFGVLSAVIVFSLYWENTSGRPMIVHIGDKGVKLPMVARGRFLPWTEIEQVILRRGILTIDCVNNNLYQWNIAGDQTEDEILEAYCEARIEGSKKDRKADW